MTRLVTAVVLAVLLSGCSLLPGGGTQSSPSVTPVPVPSAPPAETADDTGPIAVDCLAPPPAQAPTAAATPDTPVPLSVGDGRANGTALVDRHLDSLSSHSYHLVVEGDRIWSTPNQSAFVWETSRPLARRGAYAVAGTLYTYLQPDNEPAFVKRGAYTEEALAVEDIPSLTGAPWLEERLAGVEYAVVGTTTWQGAQVRIFRDTLTTPTDAGDRRVSDLNSTVLVDRRGIIRYVNHTVRFAYAPPDNDTATATEVESGTYRVPAVGSVRLHRPDAFCGLAPNDVIVDIDTDGVSDDTASETTGATPA